MRYLSPASFPDSPLIDPPDKKALMLLRKKLLAELEFSADGHLYLKNRSFSKSEILEYFETLQDDTILRYYGEIGKDRILVEFLEEGQLFSGAVFAENPIYDDTPFLQWLSPYFYTAFTEYVTECLETGNEDGLKTLLQNHLLLIGYDRDRAWIRISQVVENDFSVLNHYCHQLAGKESPPSINDISPLVADSYMRMILLLPKEPFAGIRDKYAAAIMQVSIHVFNTLKDNRDIPLAWIKHAKTLAVSEDLSAEVAEKIGEMEKIQKKGNRRLIRIAIFIGVIAIKALLLQNADSISNDIPKVTRFNYINGKDTINVHDIKQLDSLLNPKKLADSALRLQIH